MTKAAVAKPGKAVATTKRGSTAVATQPSTMDLFLARAGEGLENATSRDFALPWLLLLQDLSPQCKKREPTYVEGAEPGMWFNSVTGELFEKLNVIPVDFQKVYNEWIPRDAGGGFVKSYQDRGEAETNKQENTVIVDTANHYVLAEGGNGDWGQAIVSMTSTKLKISRTWMSKIAQRLLDAGNGTKKVAPSYSTIYELGSVETKNDKGIFFIPTITQVGWVEDAALVELAVDFRSQIQSGAKGADFSTVVEAVVEEAPAPKGKNPKY